jgi:hypothetical protein
VSARSCSASYAPQPAQLVEIDCIAGAYSRPHAAAHGVRVASAQLYAAVTPRCLDTFLSRSVPLARRRHDAPELTRRRATGRSPATPPHPPETVAPRCRNAVRPVHDFLRFRVTTMDPEVHNRLWTRHTKRGVRQNCFDRSPTNNPISNQSR